MVATPSPSSVRFEPRVFERLSAFVAAHRDLTLSSATSRLVDEALRIREHPLITFKDGPAGPSLNVMSGCSRIRSASSTSLLVALDRVRSRCAATNAESRSNTRGSNRTDEGLGVATMYYNVGECKRRCKRLVCYPGTGVGPGSVVSRGGSAARGDQEHVGCPLPRPTRQLRAVGSGTT